MDKKPGMSGKGLAIGCAISLVFLLIYIGFVVMWITR